MTCRFLQYCFGICLKWKTILFFISFLILICFLIEVLFRFLDFPKNVKLYPLAEPHPYYHHFHKPEGLYYEEPNIGDTYEAEIVKFNKLGLRDYEPKDQLPKIIFIGDSFVEARQVNLNAMFGNIIERALRNIDIINVGCSSWSSIIYYNWLTKNLDKFSLVKHVYLFYVFNDSFNTLSYLGDSDNPSNILEPSFKQYTKKDFLSLKEHKFKIRQRLKIMFFLSKVKTGIMNTWRAFLSKKRIIKEEEKKMLDVYNAQSLDIFKSDFQYLILIKQLLSKKKIKFSVVYLPMGLEVSLEETKKGNRFFSLETKKLIHSSEIIENALEKISKKYEFEFISLKPELREFKKKNPLVNIYNNVDGHFSAEGHRVVANILLKLIKN